MKTTRLLLLILLPLLVMACGRGGDRESLVRLDSLAWTAPDSAWHRLVSLPADSLPTAGDRAYHAVLVAEAAYRAYRPATSDSAILAAERYYAHGDRAKHLRALMACGTTAEELGHPEQAMRRYKQAEALARDLRDTFRTGYALLRQAELYQSAYARDSIGIAKYKAALFCFNRCGKSHYRNLCLNRVASLYRATNTDSALLYARRCIGLAGSDTISVVAANIILAGTYYNSRSYQEAVNTASETISRYADRIIDNQVYAILALSYIQLGRGDMAGQVMARAPQAHTPEDRMNVLEIKGEIERARGDEVAAARLSAMADSIADSLLINSRQPELLTAERDADLEQLNRLQFRKRLKDAVLASVIILLVSTAFLLITRRHKRKIRSQQERLTQLDATLRQHLAQLSKLQDRIRSRDLTAEDCARRSIDPLNDEVVTLKTLLAELYTQAEKSKPLKNWLDTKLAYTHDNPLWSSLRSIADARTNNLVDRLADRYSLSDNDVKFILLVYLDFDNETIRQIMGLSNVRSVSNKKRELPRSKFGVDITLDELRRQYANGEIDLTEHP